MLVQFLLNALIIVVSHRYSYRIPTFLGTFLTLNDSTFVFERKPFFLIKTSLTIFLSEVEVNFLRTEFTRGRSFHSMLLKCVVKLSLIQIGN